LTESEHQKWEKYRLNRINSHKDAYIKAIQELAAKGEHLDILQDLQDWYQSLLPY
jgi:exonuclease I